ncbi:ATG C terminal domain-containing protein [Tribonema minus]|uniref:Autophagy-related protein 2 n=1 Tax=Tribonema minus TaxID=303371 RepID=A0A835YJZ3_9STRA|nr:ATG C terminal domain-containing protein [Tribonema minus]
MVTLQLTARSPGTQATIIAAAQHPPGSPSAPRTPLVIGDEYMLRVRLLPLHLSFGQHTIDFLTAFAPPPPPSNAAKACGSDQGGGSGGGDDQPDEMSLFLQSCDIGPFKLRIDYQPRLINLRALQNGAYLELLNLFPLEGVGLQVERVQLSGVTGFAAVVNACLESWVRDVTGSQLHKFLAGTAAVRPLVNVGRGMADLVLVPLKQYKRDGKILRGIRKGTAQCAGRVLAETLNTSYKLVRYVSRTLDDIVTPGAADGTSRAMQCYDVQPRGVMDSLEQAYVSLSREVLSAAHTIVAIPYEEREELGGYARTVVRALPIAVLRPVIGATEAVSFALLGFRNTLQPGKKKEEEAQWQ